MIEGILTRIVEAVIPSEYLPAVLILMTAWVALEQWLASTHRLKANSTVELITNIFNRIVTKKGDKNA